MECKKKLACEIWANIISKMFDSLNVFFKSSYLANKRNILLCAH